MKKEAAVFAFILLGATGIFDYLQSPYPDEIWLTTGILSALVAYLLRPDRQEGLLNFTGPIILLVLGAYLAVIKLPKLLSGLINYRLAGLLCLALYLTCCWLMITQRKGLKQN